MIFSNLSYSPSVVCAGHGYQSREDPPHHSAWDSKEIVVVEIHLSKQGQPAGHTWSHDHVYRVIISPSQTSQGSLSGRRQSTLGTSSSQS